MNRERTPGMYPIADPPPDSLFVHDTRTAAELLNISPRLVRELARSRRLLFKFVPSTGKYQCPQADIDSYEREMQQHHVVH